MTQVNIIGAGRVGQTFLKVLGSNVGDVASARYASAVRAVEQAGQGRATEVADMRSAEVWLLTVPDTQIRSASSDLARAGHPASIAVHCSGFHTADVMAPLCDAGWQLASAHPNLSFADPVVAAANFPGTPCGVEGDGVAVKAVENLLIEVGARPFRIASDRKALYHAAAVFSNNFATVLQAIAREAWNDAGVPEALASDINASLLRATCENTIRQGPRDALTGPAARGDNDVVASQGETVAQWNAPAGELYHVLSAMAARLKADGSL